MAHLLKSELRKQYTLLRNSLSEERRREAAKKICAVLQKKLMRFATIASFIPFRSEINIGKCNQWILREKQLVLPRIDSSSEFRSVVDFSELEKHLLGFYHPLEVSPVPDTVDCILVPALAFDTAYYRLGYGRGDYDYLIAKWPNAYSIGVGFTEQLIEKLPRESHDKPVNELILV